MNTHPFQGKTLAQVAVETPAAVSVFRKYKLDFCCGGDRPLEDAAREGGLDLNDLFSELEATVRQPLATPEQLDVPALCTSITETYHANHRRDLPLLIHLSEKVESVHRDRPECPKGATALLSAMYTEMLDHMEREETELFPALASGNAVGSERLIEELEEDHEALGEKIKQLESLFAADALPEDACTTWRALASGVEGFVDDLMEHVHLENNVLFPNVLAD